MADASNFPSFEPIWKKYAHIKNPSEYIVRRALKEYSKQLRNLLPGLKAAGWVEDKYNFDQELVELLKRSENLTKPVRLNFITSRSEFDQLLRSDDVKCVRHERPWHSGVDYFYSRPTAKTSVAKEIGALFDSFTELAPGALLVELGYTTVGVDYGNVSHEEVFVDWNVVQEFHWVFRRFIYRPSYQFPKITLGDFIFMLKEAASWMKRALWLFALLTVFAPHLIASDSLDEVNAKFAYQGTPIHPGLVQEFSSWISDKGLPTTISVDVAAPHGNEYFDGNVKLQGKNVCVDVKDGGSFCYQWLGKLDNGLHVLRAGESGGGSGVFEDLFFVKFDKGEGYTEDGKKYDRLLMSIVRTYTLGDRDDGEIKVLGDRVIVGKSSYRDKDVTLTF